MASALLLLALLLTCSLSGVVANYREHSPAGLRKRTRNPDAAVRIDAARELSRKRAPGAVEALVSLLDDPEPAIRVFAAGRLGALGAREAAARVAAMLESTNEQEVSQAVATAGILREPVAVAPLVSLLGKGRMVTRVEEALVRIGRPAVGALAGGHHCHTLALMEKKRPGSTEPLPSYLERRDLQNLSQWIDYYIFLGRAGSEGTLVETLGAHGGKLMAEKYMNSGNPALAEAGKRWWLGRGYELPAAGSTRAPAGGTWGN